MYNSFSLLKRASGLLLPMSSLPGSHGIGDLGPAAFQFVDFLHQAGQSWWQICPLGPLGFGYSPYQTLSVFAGNELYLSIEVLVQEGWLKNSDIRSTSAFAKGRVDYDRARNDKGNLFRLAFGRFQKTKSQKQIQGFRNFCRQNAFWLQDYALYRVLKEHFHDAPWWEWEEDIRVRKSPALKEARNRFKDEIFYHEFLQYQFFSQWAGLKEYASQEGVGFIGDIPIFVAADSADVWAYPRLFKLDKTGRCRFVAGVPPDYFSEDGQKWGNPVYRWDVLKKQEYHWWIERFRAAFELFEVVRLDHFIGFCRYWEIPASLPTAKHGRWRKGPGPAFFKTVFQKLGAVQFIAEDLGVVTKEVKDLRDQFRLPGMKVLQFAFGDDPEAESYLPHNFSRHCVVYTGTHDNDTTVGWFHDHGSRASTRTKDQIKKEKKFALLYLNSDGKKIHWDMIRLALMSSANTSIVPVQDVLGLGSEARFNLPGRFEANWQWRLKPADLKKNLAKTLHYWTRVYGRDPMSNPSSF